MALHMTTEGNVALLETLWAFFFKESQHNEDELRMNCYLPMTSIDTPNGTE